LFANGFTQDLLIRHGLKTLFAEVNDFFSRHTQCVNGGHRNPHIGKELHAAEVVKG